MTSTESLVWGGLAHLAADFLLQNEWMAEHKVSLRHPAAWVHAGIHGAALALVFPPVAALLLAFSHLLVDTRVPLQWWRRVFGQTRNLENPVSLHVAIWSDQVLHLGLIAAAAGLCGRRG